MIISHKYKYIYIKNKKAAGSTIQGVLGKFAGDDDIFTPMGHKKSYFNDNIARNYKGFGTHFGAKEIIKKIDPKIWNTYYKFCFVRNPYDLMISWFCWLNTRKELQTKERFIKWIDEKFKRLKDYVRPIDNLKRYTINGKIIVDFRGKYENLINDLNFVLEKLGIDYKVTEENIPRLKTTQRKNRMHYSKFYDEKTIEYVSKAYRRELKLNDYKFEDWNNLCNE
jgi:hypothetical protein